jgi:hypothetical protein
LTNKFCFLYTYLTARDPKSTKNEMPYVPI